MLTYFDENLRTCWYWTKENVTFCWCSGFPEKLLPFEPPVNVLPRLYEVNDHVKITYVSVIIFKLSSNLKRRIKFKKMERCYIMFCLMTNKFKQSWTVKSGNLELVLGALAYRMWLVWATGWNCGETMKSAHPDDSTLRSCTCLHFENSSILLPGFMQLHNLTSKSILSLKPGLIWIWPQMLAW